MVKSIATLLLVLAPFFAIAQKIHKRSLLLMGSDFEITVVANNLEEANNYIDLAVAEIVRLEKMISSWDPDSETSKINNNAGISAVKVSDELLHLIARAQLLSGITDGAFDITYASMDRIWKFDGSMTEMPSEEKIKESVRRIGDDKVLLDLEKKTVFLEETEMKIGFGGIGKGFAADKAKALLQKLGVTGGIINAAGDMNTWGTQPNGESWKVAITNPLDKNKSFAILPIQGAVVTSGDYEKYVIFNDKRYTHIIDPRTGYPATGIISVTIFAEKAEVADALATSVFVMGKEVGLDRINQLDKVECIIISEDGGIHTSKNINLKTKE